MEYPKGLGTIWPEDAEQPPITAYFSPPRTKKYSVRWILLWQDESHIGVSMAEQAKKGVLTQTDYRVRDYVISVLGVFNYTFVNQTHVARELNVRKASVCESIKRLCEMGILIKGQKSGRSNTYMANPAFCFSGGLGEGVKQRKEVIKQRKQKSLSTNI